jgi:hypothetical protein
MAKSGRGVEFMDVSTERSRCLLSFDLMAMISGKYIFYTFMPGIRYIV